MYNPNEKGFSTNQIHAARPEPVGPAPLATPIYQTSTYIFADTQQGAARFAGEEEGYIYTRLHNPNGDEAAARIACLEGGEAGMLTGSGMGAITATLWTLLKSGDHILSDCTLYGCTYALFTEGLPRFGVETTLVDFCDPDAIRRAMRPETKVVYCETATNPDLKIIDIEMVSRIVHEINPEVMLMVDNTFTSPYLVQPLKLGADIVVHSATKYLGGHSDLVAGLVVVNSDALAERLAFLQNATGGVLGPFDAFLLIRGIKTLALRMDRHVENAQRAAEWLKGNPAVKLVYYPGLPDDPGYEINRRQARNGGAMISFELDEKHDFRRFFTSLKLVTLAESLGGVESLVCHPATMTHAAIPRELRVKVGITDNLIRLSVGIESIDDILADLEQAIRESEV